MIRIETESLAAVLTQFPKKDSCNHAYCEQIGLNQAEASCMMLTNSSWRCGVLLFRQDELANNVTICWSSAEG